MFINWWLAQDFFRMICWREGSMVKIFECSFCICACLITVPSLPFGDGRFRLLHVIHWQETCCNAITRGVDVFFWLGWNLFVDHDGHDILLHWRWRSLSGPQFVLSRLGEDWEGNDLQRAKDTQKGKCRWFLTATARVYLCQGLNSHYFHIIGDGHQPNSRGLYTHYKDSY